MITGPTLNMRNDTSVRVWGCVCVGVCVSNVLQARMLMVEENLMTTIIRTFVDHLRHRDPQGRFQFDRYTAQQAFKFGRVQSLIGDLK